VGELDLTPTLDEVGTIDAQGDKKKYVKEKSLRSDVTAPIYLRRGRLAMVSWRNK